jgi:hypothetical protein
MKVGSREPPAAGEIRERERDEFEERATVREE